MLEPIKLTDEEQELWSNIYFMPSLVGGDFDALKASLVPAHDLARSLIEREAIPEIRMRYFTDPDFNIGYKRSRKAIFEMNGTIGDAILSHPHFLPFLRYFVLGPDLPRQTVASFASLVDDCHPITSGDQATLCDFAKRAVRTLKLERRAAAEEFFKLALECDLHLSDARAIRDTVMRLRIK